MKKKYSNKFSVAPMFKYTDQHCLYFYRQLTKKTFLYTEMITIQKMLFSKKLFKKKQIKKNNPIAIQLAGNNPLFLSLCAKKAYFLGFKEINLNIGCPSKKAKSGNFGIYLMNNPILVYNLIKAIYLTVPIQISIKIRLGTNENKNYRFLKNFIQLVSKNNYCIKYIIHARIANLQINSPKKNRNIPLLNYSYVYKIKKDFPHLIIIINGGIKTINEINEHLKNVDGVMMGREIYKNPLFLRKIDKKIFFQKKQIKIKKFIKKMSNYIKKKIIKGVPAIKIIKHMLNIFYKLPQAKKWKHELIQKTIYKNQIDDIFNKIHKLFDKKF
ncbi:tRNA dihydrouridine(20/20a) synthase DusA [Buchnera aphidicola]|nr:tRNA dihydrouridine(20/20a) synthase DusA [Buchnera aphidicola]